MSDTSKASSSEAVTVLDSWVREYGKDVINVAYSYLKNYHQAQDVAQDVFLRAYSNIGSFRGDSSAKTWLLAITVNRCKDLLRSWTSRHEVAYEDTELSTLASGSNTEQEVTERLERDRLWEIVHSLPVKYREVVVLYYQRGLSSSEAAAVLDCSEQNVRTRLHRAREMLKQRLAQGGESHSAGR
ncbi:sigma-70 family RNA polymerase sigma factor [Alicyclobacillus tolerans]|uniref:sigma-70 family RNA polymerase sigma factor n=1 Tax=Alicyclobacillus tolerans TaxID=90970 RepID=UPI001F025879|nr:sigma-70 family RNA polymerase sigma factor [Alicyclobacillus tolerans]MCF8566080.1 sigma-70 family RNA polymerase sigma factor [Alicyclobacillus tolerans]